MVYSTNFFFNNFQNSGEQQLYGDLVRESISIHGQLMYYVPRNIVDYNALYGADDQSSYTKAFSVPIYVENFDAFQGQGNFYSKFGLEIRDQVILSVSQTVFSAEVSRTTQQPRPNEGDLIYFPLNNKCFQIKSVDKFQMFYPLGALYTWKMTCELFEYSNEVINTGIPQIDILQTKFSTNVFDFAILAQAGVMLLTQDGNYLVQENTSFNKQAADDSKQIETESNKIVNFSVADPFSEGNI